MENKRTVEERIMDAGYEDVLVFSDNEYDTALIGVSEDNRAVYDYDMMVEWLIENDNISEEDAIDWIDYNTLRSLSYYEGAPIIVYRV